MIGQSNLVGKGAYGMEVRNRIAQLSVLSLADSALTTDYITGSGNATLATRKRADGTAPKGMLSGHIVAATAAGAAVYAATGLAGDEIANGPVVGLALNDAVGNAYESSSGFASGKAVYLCGSGSVATVDIYEAGTWAVGDLVYASFNGLITNVLPVSTELIETAVIGVVLDVDSTEGITIQLRF